MARASLARLRYNCLMSGHTSRQRFVLGAISLLCLGAFLAVPAPAQQGGSNFDLEGKISERSKNRLTVDTGQGILFHVTFDDKTSIVRADSSAGSEEDLKVGVKVHAIGVLEDSGDIQAQKIEIEAPEKSAKPPSPQG
jgi:hypothetical protein